MDLNEMWKRSFRETCPVNETQNLRTTMALPFSDCCSFLRFSSIKSGEELNLDRLPDVSGTNLIQMW